MIDVPVRDACGDASFTGGCGGSSWLLDGSDVEGSEDSLMLSPRGPRGPKSSLIASAWTKWRPGRRGARRAPAEVVGFGGGGTIFTEVFWDSGAFRAIPTPVVSSLNPDSSAGRLMGGVWVFSERSSPHGEVPSWSRSREVSDGGETPEVIVA